MRIALAADTKEQFSEWQYAIEQALQGWIEVQISRVEDLEVEERALVFCTPKREDVKQEHGRIIVLVVDNQSDPMPEALARGQVDDLIAAPFNRVDLISRLIHFERALALREVKSLDAGVRGVISLLEQDLGLAERLQRSRLPKKFPDLRGVRVTSRYVAGERSGGDYFDVLDAEDGSGLSFVLSDSSSYGLSSSVLALLMRMTAQLARPGGGGVRETLSRVLPEVRAVLGASDSLGVFLGTLSRKDLMLRYMSLGQIQGWVVRGGKISESLRPQGKSMDRGRLSVQELESAFKLEPADRLIMSTDGFLEAAGGETKIGRLIESHAARPPEELLTELAFFAKRGLGDDDLPQQDCSCIVVDIDARAMRVI